MRFKQFNFAVAVAASLAAHALLWPASKRILLSGDGSDSNPANRGRELTLLLAPDATEKPTPADPAHAARAPVADPPEDMGESTGKGTGAQAAKGDQPLQAPQADQDQAFLSRDPVGHGRVGDPPSEYTGPRGEDGTGGQRGGPNLPPSPPAHDSPTPIPAPPKEIMPPAASPDRPANQSTVHVPDPAVPRVTPPTEVAPSPSPKASAGTSTPDLAKPPADAIKAANPLTQVASTADGNLLTRVG